MNSARNGNAQHTTSPFLDVMSHLLLKKGFSTFLQMQLRERECLCASCSSPAITASQLPAGQVYTCRLASSHTMTTNRNHDRKSCEDGFNKLLFSVRLLIKEYHRTELMGKELYMGWERAAPQSVHKDDEKELSHRGGKWIH